MRSAQSSLAVDVRPDEQDPSTVRVRLDGELDITSSPLLETVVEQVLQARRAAPLPPPRGRHERGRLRRRVRHLAAAAGARHAGPPRRAHRAAALPPRGMCLLAAGPAARRPGGHAGSTGRLRRRLASAAVRLVIAPCTVDYVGRLTAHLPSATAADPGEGRRLGVVHADDRAYKPLNWMSPPCTLRVGTGDDEGVWTVTNKAGERLVITIEEVLHDSRHELGVDPGLVKDGVEAHLQALLAEQIETLGAGWRLVRREYPTAIGPVDILARDAGGATVAIEIKRRGEIDGVEQLTRYLELLNRDSPLAPVRGVFAAQEIKPQARVLALDRGIDCVTLDYDALRGFDDADTRLF